jgi:hypothetical protein
MGHMTQSAAVGTTDWVDLGAGPMVLQVSSWLHAASRQAEALLASRFELEAATTGTQRAAVQIGETFRISR